MSRSRAHRLPTRSPRAARFACEPNARGIEPLRLQCGASNEHKVAGVRIRRRCEHGAYPRTQKSLRICEFAACVQRSNVRAAFFAFVCDKACSKRGVARGYNRLPCMAVLPVTRLGPYEIEFLLGAGGMGQVYRARDTRLDRVVAIKILPAELGNDPTRQAGS
jgi:hypothetical protein